MPPNSKEQASRQEWDLGSFWGREEEAGESAAYAVVLLNTSLSPQYKHSVQRIWRNASVRVCADGAANGLLDMVGYDGWNEMPLPTLICGDLDSIRDETQEFFATRGVEIRQLPSSYSTDLQKSIQTIEDIEKQSDIGAYPLMILGGLSGRLDQTMHTLHVLWQLAPGVQTGTLITESYPAGEEPPRGSTLQKRAKTLVVSDNCVTCLLCAGSHRVENDRNLLGPSCGILPLGAGPSGVHVETQGLEWNLYGEPSFLGGFLSTSNRLAPDNPHGRVEIQTDAPVYWTIELRQDT
ncbi:ribonuclease Z [Malassezia yamatoensis]|uniref:Ribonuclease Z n=1 Tax=Malassezia yamatoensis TaxID=253288 RepID=A0AAJ6CHW9_9BASI|nr:ribonuclease Z [Malassezia yamatoensis]